MASADNNPGGQQPQTKGTNGTMHTLMSGTDMEMPRKLLESFIPGYSLVSGIILEAFGFDISIVVFGGVALYAAQFALSYVWFKTWQLIEDYCMASIHIEDCEYLYDDVAEWFRRHQMCASARSVRAVNFDFDDDEDELDQVNAVTVNGVYNYRQQAAALLTKYEIHGGAQVFWHKGRYFTYQKLYKTGRWGTGERIVIRCVGRSTEPIRQLVREMKQKIQQKRQNKINIHRPRNKANEDRHSNPWAYGMSRPVRPMSTISLDAKQKRAIIQDVNEYLHPTSPEWYATRGIPWRRGYLFSGPPGTGKSSLSFALAGLFGLDIFVVSLADQEVDESWLNCLFHGLPRRCVVLLEDMDSAGLAQRHMRNDNEDHSKDDLSGDDYDDDDDDDDDDNDDAGGRGKRKRQTPTSKVSLAGLLNAIDGVAAHEGRVLVMTSNCPEKLDAALIRPGRVDMQVCFTLATYSQNYQIFKRMYSNTIDEDDPDDDAIMCFGDSQSSAPDTECRRKAKDANNLTSQPMSKLSDSLPVTPPVSGSSTPLTAPTPADKKATVVPHDSALDKHVLRTLAHQFANKVPEGKFSPAEVQGFLLMCKKDPHRAVEETDAWVELLLKSREKRKKKVALVDAE